MAAWDHERNELRLHAEPINLAGVDHRRAAVAEDWRRRATQLDEYAKRCRRDGDTREAMDAEQAAVDYRVAADEHEGTTDA